MTDSERYHALCIRIREHCIQHGPDGEDRAYFWPIVDMELLDGPGRSVGKEPAEPRYPFLYPPATEEQLQATEDAIGFSVPPLLRMLYAEIANGGFGPSYGITGARGGFSVNEDGRYDTIDCCTDTDPKLTYVELSALDTVPDDEPFTIDLPITHWPTRFLHLAYDGCSCDFWLDTTTDRIYYGEPNQIAIPNELLQRITGDPNATSLDWTVYLKRVAPSLESWLEAWLRGDHDGVYGPLPTMQDDDIPY